MARTKNPSLYPVFKKAEEAIAASKEDRLLLKLYAIAAYGKSEAQVPSDFCRVTRTTIYRWVAQFKENGIDGLRDRKKGHNPARLNEAHRKEITKWIETSKTPDNKPIVKGNLICTTFGSLKCTTSV